MNILDTSFVTDFQNCPQMAYLRTVEVVTSDFSTGKKIKSKKTITESELKKEIFTKLFYYITSEFIEKRIVDNVEFMNVATILFKKLDKNKTISFDKMIIEISKFYDLILFQDLNNVAEMPREIIIKLNELFAMELHSHGKYNKDVVNLKLKNEYLYKIQIPYVIQLNNIEHSIIQIVNSDLKKSSFQYNPEIYLPYYFYKNFTQTQITKIVIYDIVNLERSEIDVKDIKFSESISDLFKIVYQIENKIFIRNPNNNCEKCENKYVCNYPFGNLNKNRRRENEQNIGKRKKPPQSLFERIQNQDDTRKKGNL